MYYDYYQSSEDTGDLVFKMMSISIISLNNLRGFGIAIRDQLDDKILARFNKCISPVINKILYVPQDKYMDVFSIKNVLYKNINVNMFSVNPRFADSVALHPDPDYCEETRYCEYAKYTDLEYIDNNRRYPIEEQLTIFKCEDYNIDNENVYDVKLFKIKFDYSLTSLDGSYYDNPHILIRFEAVDDLDDYTGYGHVHCLDCLFNLLKYGGYELIETIRVTKFLDPEVSFTIGY